MNQQEKLNNGEIDNIDEVFAAENDSSIPQKESIDKKKFFKNIFIVLLSNFVSILSGVLVGFIVPKMMGVSEYGYYKTFTLYCSYIGLFHFGFVDGIYLKFAGKKYEQLDKEKFRTYTRFLLIFELLISLIVLSISFCFVNTNYNLIIIFVSINILAKVMNSYFEFISQIVMNFKRSSIRLIIGSLLNIISVLILFFLYKYNEVQIFNTYYVAITIGINYLMALWYLFSYRDIVFGKATPIKNEFEDIKFIFKIGFPLLISNLISQFIFLVDQQFVNIFFDNDTYSIYAFAYNMITLVTIATNAISVVLYPTLKTMNNESITSNYSKINAYLLVFVAFCMCVYYPLEIIVNGFLPKYIDSLPIFAIVLPGIIISSSISVIKYNCYKTFGKINNYFIKSLIVLIIAIVADACAYLIFKNTISISIVSMFVLLFWYILIELFFIRNYKVAWKKNMIYMLLVISGFYGIYFIPNVFLAFGIYILFVMILTSILYNNLIKEMFLNFKNKFLRKNN